MEKRPILGRVEILLAASCFANQNKCRPYRPLDSMETFSYPLTLLDYKHFKSLSKISSMVKLPLGSGCP